MDYIVLWPFQLTTWIEYSDTNVDEALLIVYTDLICQTMAGHNIVEYGQKYGPPAIITGIMAQQP